MTKPPKRGPEDPAEWLKRAQSSLIQARTRTEGVYFEDLCFNAHQAAEKALKGLLLKLGAAFPFTHDIVRLNTEVEKKLRPLPGELVNAEFLSAYSVASRYPGWDEPISEAEYLKAVEAASRVVAWVGSRVMGA